MTQHFLQCQDIAAVHHAEELMRRRFIRLAEQHPAWREIAASFALSGIHVTEDNAAIAGELTLYDILEKIKQQHFDRSQKAPNR